MSRKIFDFPSYKALLFNSLLSFVLVSFVVNGTHADPSAQIQDEAMLKEVYDNLKKVVDDQRKSWPTISSISVRNGVASYVSHENTIYVDREAIDICKRFGPAAKDALAFVIGHEMTHFYQKHEWKVSGFVSYFMVSVEDFREHREHERQADIYGGFIAQQAGYSTIALVPDLLEAIYQTYALSENENDTYPSLSERKLLAAESCQIAGDLINAYQTANYMMVIGYFEEAFNLYDYISKSIKFKELHNNMGLASLSALLLLENTGLQYPLEISTDIPIERSGVFRSRKSMADAAEKHLRTAFQWDPGYADAAIHLISALDLNQKTGEALRLFQRLRKSVLTPKQSAKLFISAGNLFAREGNKAEATSYYQQALSQKAGDYYKDMAQDNLNQSLDNNGGRPPLRIIPMQKVVSPVDEIDLGRVNTFSRQIQVNPEYTFFSTEISHSVITSFQSDNRKIRIQFVHSPKVTVDGIGIGSPAYLLSNKFPKGFETYRFNDGIFLMQISKGLIFQVNDQGIIENWGVFIF